MPIQARRDAWTYRTAKFVRRHYVGVAASALIAGLLVGFGSALGAGCTSGHGICGISRLSPRSILATLVFMAVAIVTVFLVRHVV